MSAPAEQRIDLDLGSAKAKAKVTDAARRSGRSASAFARDAVLAAADASGAASSTRLPRDRRGFRAAAHMARCAVLVRRLLDEIDDESIRLRLQDAVDETAKAIAELGSI